MPPKDDKELARALISLISDEPLRRQMGAQGMLTAQGYDWARVARRVLDYYVRILSEPPWRRHFPEYEAVSASV